MLADFAVTIEAARFFGDPANRHVLAELRLEPRLSFLKGKQVLDIGKR